MIFKKVVSKGWCKESRGAKVKPDHGRYLAMIELYKTDNLTRLSLYELIRVLLREYMTAFKLFSLLYCPKTQHLAYRGNFPLHMHTVFKQSTKAAKVGK